jgi:hypothetical protein
MASGNGRMSAAWAWNEALCGVVPPLISPLNATGELDPDAVALLGAAARARVAAIVRRSAAALAR